MEYLIVFFLSAICYRLRGSSQIGTQSGRILYWAMPMSSLLVARTGDMWMFLTVIPLWLGVLPGYFGGQFDLDKKDNRNFKNYARLTLRGMFICLPLAVCWFYKYPQLFYAVLAGIAFVPCYFLPLAWRERTLGGIIGIILWGLL